MMHEESPVVHGNAGSDTADTRGWLIGNFIPEELGLRHSKDVELKWSTHRAGESRDEWVTGETRTAIGILVSGKFEIEFRDRKLTFSNPGEYVMWGPGTDHRWYVPEDCVWLTVRWPSVPAE